MGVDNMERKSWRAKVQASSRGSPVFSPVAWGFFSTRRTKIMMTAKTATAMRNCTSRSRALSHWTMVNKVIPPRLAHDLVDFDYGCAEVSTYIFFEVAHHRDV